MHTDLFHKAKTSLLIFGIFYVSCLIVLLIPNLQSNLFYLNQINFPFFAPLEHPSAWGFSEDRARSIRLEHDLLAWHIEPSRPTEDRGPQSIIIYFHGTAGNIATSHRVATYRLLTSIGENNILALDYRGYGMSPGRPSEPGIIDDGVNAVRWALAAGFKAENITLYGQSLGAAVAIAVAHHLALEQADAIHVKQVVSVAGFTSAKDIARSYRLAGFIPILGPLRTYPWLQNFFLDRLQQTWDSRSRAYELAKNTDIKLTFAHAKTDTEIPCQHSELLFRAAFEGHKARSRALESSLVVQATLGQASPKQLNYGTATTYLELDWGGHNRVQWHDELLRRI